MFFDTGTLWVLPVTYSYLPKSARAHFSPKVVSALLGLPGGGAEGGAREGARGSPGGARRDEGGAGRPRGL